MADIRELIDKCTKESEFMNFKEKFKETINQNLFKGKQNTEWVNECIEKFALFISERYKNIEEFFELNTKKNSGNLFPTIIKYYSSLSTSSYSISPISSILILLVSASFSLINDAYFFLYSSSLFGSHKPCCSEHISPLYVRLLI